MPSLTEELAALQGRPEPEAGPAEAPPPAAVTPQPGAPAPAPAPIAAAPAAVAPGLPGGAALAAPVVASAGVVAPQAPGQPGAPQPGVVDPNAPPQAPQRRTFASVDEASQAFHDQQGRAATERAARRAAERVAQEQAQQMALMQSNFQTLMTRVLAGQGAPGAPPQAQPPQQQQFVPPSAEEIARDPMAAINRLAAFAQAAIQERQDLETQQREHAHQARQNQVVQMQQAQAVHAVATSLRDHEAEFEIVQPDYQQAVTYYVDARKKQLATMYPGFDDDRLTNAITHEVLQSAHQALRAGANPASLLYQAATHLGYRYAPQPQPQPGAIAPGAMPGAVMPGQFGAVPGYPAAPVQPQATNPLAAVQAGQAAATSLSAGGGGAPGADESLAAGLTLDGAAFSSWSEKFLEQHTGRRYG